MFNKFFTKQKAKLVLALVIALIGTSLLSKRVFWLNTPRVSPQFIADVKNTPYYLKTIPARTLASIQAYMQRTFNKAATENYAEVEGQIPAVTPPASTIFAPIKTGVYAGHDEESGKGYYKIEAGTQVYYQEFTYTEPDGTQKKVVLPIPVALLTPGASK